MHALYNCPAYNELMITSYILFECPSFDSKQSRTRSTWLSWLSSATMEGQLYNQVIRNPNYQEHTCTYVVYYSIVLSSIDGLLSLQISKSTTDIPLCCLENSEPCFATVGGLVYYSLSTEVLWKERQIG